MKVLILGIPGSGFMQDLFKELHKQEQGPEIYFYNPFGKQEEVIKYEPEILENNSKINNAYKGGKRSVLLQLYKSAIILKGALMKHKFDVVHIFFLHIFYVFIFRSIRRNTKSIVITIFGSDFYRNNSWAKKVKGTLLRRADKITTTNPQTAEDLFRYYNSLNPAKQHIIRFGNSNLSIIDRYKNLKDRERLAHTLKLPMDKKIIVVGYSANYVHQHIKILEQINKIDEKLKDEVCLVFPLTYGNHKASIANEIENYLRNSTFSYRLIDDFLSVEELAGLRVVTDVFISLPLSDQLSRTLKESIYAGNIVITGSWLPYRILNDAGVDYFKIDNLSKLPLLLSDLLNENSNYQIDREKNKRIIAQDSQWSKKIIDWLALYDIQG
ncbi:4-alpha-L-fucosyltransferase [Salinivirga cyanobacteriivorans]|uniref:4-alpha-L-fucosyltransferase n=1 Tax=Salinivirga cyanobacteriivorans TaxID=1307839 RepID=A0A0S2HW53_9BACT|nr:glycosyltransferase [Salinivirga cyanobacteriivorans]ALO14234.1 4-alpha-L-fucosyltransferase [Salinivirga cyanobacteriivorans]